MTARIALSVLFALGALGAASCSSSVEQSSVTSGGNTGGGGGNAGGGDSSVGGGNAGGGGGSPAVCSDVSGDYGPCEAELGWGFDGASCKLFSGCDCAPNCGGFFPDAVSCALGCAAAGQCDAEEMKGLYLAADSFEPGTQCDGVYICTPDSSYSDVDDLYPGISCEIGICEGYTKHCAAAYHGVVTEEQWETLCAASLLPGIDAIYCVIYGP
jgi:hypothetical protein